MVGVKVGVRIQIEMGKKWLGKPPKLQQIAQLKQPEYIQKSTREKKKIDYCLINHILYIIIISVLPQFFQVYLKKKFQL